MIEKLGEFPGTQRVRCQMFGQYRGVRWYGARHRGQNPFRAPTTDIAYSHQSQNFFRKFIDQHQSSRHPALVLAHHGSNFFLGQLVFLVQFPDQRGLFQ